MKMLKVENGANLPESRPAPLAEQLDISASHLIFGYLSHSCYSETAMAFLSHWLGTSTNRPALESSLCPSELFAMRTMDYRRRLRSLFQDGRIAEALQYLEEFFPQILSSSNRGAPSGTVGDTDGWLRFQILCQQFVEMVRVGDASSALEFTESTLSPLAQGRSRLINHLQVRRVVDKQRVRL